MASIREDVYDALDGESDYQDQKWGRSANPHSPVEFLVYMRDYIEEALHLATRNADPAANKMCMDITRKIGALAVASMECNGIVPR